MSRQMMPQYPQQQPHHLHQQQHMQQQQNMPPQIFTVPPALQDRIANTLQVTTIYNPQAPPQMQQQARLVHRSPVMMQQQIQVQVPPVSSMISPPMENAKQIPPWHQNRQNFVLPSINHSTVDNRTSTPCFAMSSFLDDDRSTETPAPIPIECQLGPETPEPSLPSPSPPSDENSVENGTNNREEVCDTSEFLRLTLTDDFDDYDGRKRKRRSSELMKSPPTKRHRRSKAEMLADHQRSLRRSILESTVHLPKLEVKTGDTFRVFARTNGPNVVKANLPRVPRMKMTPRVFPRIVNIGFIKTPKGFVYSCLSNCHYKTYSSYDFLCHLHNHGTANETGLVKDKCALCQQTVGESLIDEFRHLASDHIVPHAHLLQTYEILHSKIIKIRLTIDDSDDEVEPESNVEKEANPTESEVPAPAPSLEEVAAPSEAEIPDVPLSEEQKAEMANALTGLDEFLASVDDDREVEAPESEIETEAIEESHEAADSDFNPASEDESDDEPISDDVTTDEESLDEGSTTDINSDDSFPPPSPPTLRNAKKREEEKELRKGQRRLERRRFMREEKRERRKEQNRVEALEKVESPRRGKSKSQEKQLPKLRLQQLIDKTVEASSRRNSSSGSDVGQKASDNEKKVDEQIVVEPKKPAEEKISNETADNPKENVNPSGESSEVKKPASPGDFLKNIPKKILQKIKQKSDEPSQLQIKNFLMASRLNTVTIDQQVVKQNEAKLSSEVIELSSSATEPSSSIEEIESSLGASQSSSCTVELTRIAAEITNKTGSSFVEISSSQSSSDLHPLEPVPKKKFEILEHIVLQPKAQSNAQSANVTAKKKTGPMDKYLTSNKKNSKPVLTARKSTGGVSKRPPSSPPSIREENIFKTKKKLKLTVRKSTSQDSLRRTELYNAYEATTSTQQVKPCSVNVVRCQSTLNGLKLIIRKGAVGVLETTDPFATMMDTNDTEIPESLETDNGITEIDYEEDSTAVEALPTALPVAMKDFPALLDESIASQPLAPEAPMDKRMEIDEDEFFDSLDSLEIPATPAPLGSCDTTPDLSQEPPTTLLETPEIIPEPVVAKTIPEAQVNMSKLYPWVADDVVEKIFKTKSCAVRMLAEDFLFSTYKCMSIACTFYTYDLQEFEEHLEDHSGSDKHFICSYCLCDEVSRENLIEHLKSFHKFDRYQCGKCMYRACEKFYCDRHRKKFHEHESCDILKSTSQKFVKSDRKKVEQEQKQKLSEIIKPFKCRCELDNRPAVDFMFEINFLVFF